LIDEYTEGLKSGIDYEERKGVNCLTCGHSRSMLATRGINGFDQLFCVLKQKKEVSEDDHCDDYN